MVRDLPPDREPLDEMEVAGGDGSPAGPTSDDRTMAMLAHLGGIFTGFVVPLIVWLVKKDQSRYVEDQSKEALNFQLTLLIGDLIGATTACFVVGFFIIAAVRIVAIIFGIMGTTAVNRGEKYRYPFALRMIQ